MDISISSFSHDIISLSKNEENGWKRYYEKERQEIRQKLNKIDEDKAKLGLGLDPKDVTDSQVDTLLQVYFGTSHLFDSRKELNGVLKRLHNADTRLECIKELQENGNDWILHRISSLRNEVNHQNENLNTVDIFINPEDLKEDDLSNFVSQCSKLRDSGKNVNVFIAENINAHKNDDELEYLYTDKQMHVFLSLNNALVNNGFKALHFSQGNSSLTYTWDLDTVIKANNQIDEYVNFIKDNNLSPFEAMLYIHKTITETYSYNEGSSIYDGRILPTIIQNKTIVCSGYATMVKAIVDRLDMPGLKADLVGCSLFKKGLLHYNLEGCHCHNLITIKDDKYKIDGHYMEDACWDAKNKKFENGRGFAHCLYPVEDLTHFSGGTIYVDYKDNSRASKTIIDPVALGISLSHLNGGKKALKDNKKKLNELYESRVKEGIKICDLYQNDSAPISMEKYIVGISKVLNIDNANTDEIKINVEQIIKDSISTHGISFATSSISTFNKPTERKKSKITFAQRDNRSQ